MAVTPNTIIILNKQTAVGTIHRIATVMSKMQQLPAEDGNDSRQEVRYELQNGCHT